MDALLSEFKTKGLGPLHFFLGIKIKRNESGMILSQTTKIVKKIRYVSVQTSKNANESESCERNCTFESKPYRDMIGCLMYVLLTTSPNLSAAVNFYNSFQSSATESQ